MRRIRQERLLAEDDPLELVAIIDESVLHRPVGGRDVMRAQLERLVSAALASWVSPTWPTSST